MARKMATLCVGALLLAGCTNSVGSPPRGLAVRTGPTRVPQPDASQMAASGLDRLPVAPASQRIDLVAPAFSHPTRVTNPLFPISDLRSAVLNGRIDGKPFHTETTLLPYTRTIEWPPGYQVQTLVSQYAAFLDGRIQEVALDYYAQADDGSVWYFGEDVADYDLHGVIAFTTDSWLAGQDGPPAMIMPGHPVVGQAFRTENVPGVVFEEVTVKATGTTVPGPPGPVQDAMVGSELHDDGARSDKVFAPGYGEFLTRDADGVEAMALAVPTDALGTPTPAPLLALEAGAGQALDAFSSGNWRAGSAALHRVTSAWRAYRGTGDAPPRLQPPMDRAIRGLAGGLHAREVQRAGDAAIDVAQAGLDLELRYRTPAEIDRDRFALWDRQLMLDSRAGELDAVNGDLATMEWTRDRFAAGLDPSDLTLINATLLGLRELVVDRDLAAVLKGGSKLERDLAGIGVRAATG